jgi:hypothetical protein
MGQRYFGVKKEFHKISQFRGISSALAMLYLPTFNKTFARPILSYSSESWRIITDKTYTSRNEFHQD